MDIPGEPQAPSEDEQTEEPPQMTIDLTEEEDSHPVSEEKPEEPQPQAPKPTPPLQEESTTLPPAIEEFIAPPLEPELQSIDEERDELTTATIAELYAKQGLFDKAIRVYKQLLEANPDNMELKFRYDQLLDRKKEEESRKKESEKAPLVMEEGEGAIKKRKINTLNKWLKTLNTKRPPHQNPDV